MIKEQSQKVTTKIFLNCLTQKKLLKTPTTFWHQSSQLNFQYSYPEPLLSNTLKASLISSSKSVSFSFLAIIARNSSKSISPLPSISTSLIIFSSSWKIFIHNVTENNISYNIENIPPLNCLCILMRVCLANIRKDLKIFSISLEHIFF